MGEYTPTVTSAPDPRDPLHAVVTALRDFSESADRMVDSAGRTVGLHRTDLRALNILMHRASAGMATSASDLGRHLNLTKPATTAVVDRLVDSGHAVRERSLQDRRRVLIHHTDSAVRVGGAAFAPMGGSLRAAFAGFSEEELHTALRVVQAATGALQDLESALPRPTPACPGHERGQDSEADDRPARPTS